MNAEEALSFVDELVFAQKNKRLNDLQRVIFLGSWEGKRYKDIHKECSDRCGLDHIMRNAAPDLWKLLSDVLGEKITKNHLQAPLKRIRMQNEQTQKPQLRVVEELEDGQPQIREEKKVTINDWGEAPDVSVFFGRTLELNRLEEWIVKDRCRLVAILGMGGIGKTALSVKVTQKIQEQFEYVIWRSLRNALPLEEFLASLICLFSDAQQTVTDKITQLINCLRNHRTLLVFDNTETILQGGERAGYYREGYEGYGELLRRVGEEPHQSCLLLTSREKPQEFAPLEGEASSVKSLLLLGLGQIEGQQILRDKGLSGSKQELTKLIQNYSGNPLALKLVSEPIRELFNGNITAFLNEGEIIFGDTRNLLDQQFKRLSSIEKEIMYWLAIKREAVSLSNLRDCSVHPLLPRDLLEALESLRRRSLIENITHIFINNSTPLFTLQPVVMEYITDQIIEIISQEITSGITPLLVSHALIEATAKDYIRNTQINLILKLIIDRLITIFRSYRNIEKKLNQILSKLQETFHLEAGYAPGNLLNLFCQLQTDLSNYDFSHLSIRQAYLQGVNLHNVNFTGSDLDKSVFSESFGSILSVAFSCESLAIGSSSGEIFLFQEQGRTTYKGHTHWVRSIAFSPDGQKFASGGDDQTIRIWDTRTGKSIRTLEEHTGCVRSVAFSEDGKLLASGSEDGTVKIWDVDTSRCLKTLTGHVGKVWAVAISPINSEGILASGAEDNTIKIWKVQTGECLKALTGHENWVRSVAFSRDGKQIVSGGDDNTVRIWDIHTEQCCVTLLGHENWVRSVAFSRDGKQIVSGSDDNTVRIWDAHTGQCQNILYGHNNRVWSVAFSLDGQKIASGSDDQTVKTWNAQTGQCLTTVAGYSNWILSVAFSPDSQYLASGSEDKIVRIWDVKTCKMTTSLRGHTSRIWSVAFSPDGRLLASGSDDRTIRIWDLQPNKGNQCLQVLTHHNHWVRSVAFSPDGNMLASGSDDHTVRIWDVHHGIPLKVLRGHTNWVRAVTFSPDGNLIASGGDDSTLMIWNFHTDASPKVLQGHTNLVRSVAFSPDGKLIASGSNDHTVKIWDVNTGECIKILIGHNKWVHSVVFSPDGQTLVSGCYGGTVYLWNVRDAQPIKSFDEAADEVLSVAFSPNGQFIASGIGDGIIHIRSRDRGEFEQPLSLTILKPYQGMNITGVIGLTEDQKLNLRALGAVAGDQPGT
jgi:WD40 repeat protein